MLNIAMTVALVLVPVLIQDKYRIEDLVAYLPPARHKVVSARYVVAMLALIAGLTLQSVWTWCSVERVAAEVWILDTLRTRNHPRILFRPHGVCLSFSPLLVPLRPGAGRVFLSGVNYGHRGSCFGPVAGDWLVEPERRLCDYG